MSYDPAVILGGFEQELGRLQAQAALSFDIELECLQRLGMRDGVTLLELGCGPGAVTSRLRRAFPNSAIVALDANASLLARAENLKLDRVTFVEADVCSTGLAGGTFDFILSRYLYQHLADPAAAAVEALRLLRPGGCHTVIDIDDDLWGIVEPRMGTSRAFAQHAAAQTHRGGDRHVGRRLWRILRDSGYAGVALDLVNYHSDALGKNAFLPQLDPERLLACIDPRQLRLEDIAVLHAALADWKSDPSGFVLFVAFVASGRKHVE